MWLENNRIYKSQPKYNTDTEFYFLTLLSPTGFVPANVRREEIELISMEYIPPNRVYNKDKFMSYYEPVLAALESFGIRHGDLTTASVLIKNDAPILIDFSESRWKPDPIVSKRPQSDRELLLKAMEALCNL